MHLFNAITKKAREFLWPFLYQEHHYIIFDEKTFVP